MSPRCTGAVAGLFAAGALLHSAPSVAVLGQWSSLRRAGPFAWRGNPASGGVALTFDDGPSPAATPAVLDRLDLLGFKATFFANGSAVDRHPDLAREIASRGHQLETHGYRHRHHLRSSPGWVAADLQAAMAAMYAVGARPGWFRPPYGQVSLGTAAAARAQGLGIALWSAWGREWAEPDADAVARRVIHRLAPGAVVLLHDSDEFSPEGSAGRALEALGAIGEHMQRHSLPSLTLDEVLR